MTDQLDTVGCIPAADGLGHLGPCHAVDEPQTENHAGLIILNRGYVPLQDSLFLGAL